MAETCLAKSKTVERVHASNPITAARAIDTIATGTFKA